MGESLKNKKVVITGGAQGIGYAIADKYLERGAKVVIIADIDDKQGLVAVRALNAKYGNNKAEFIKCDVTTDLEPAATKIINSHKVIDVLVNNAGVLNEASIKKTIGINVTALMEWSVKFFEHMRRDNGGKGGTIVNLASIYGFRVDQFLPVYQASKFAVIGFTRSFGHKYRFERYGVRSVAICPGFTHTPLIDEAKEIEDSVVQKDFREKLKKSQWQNVEAVATAAADAFERGDSGTAWLIEGNKPIVEV